MLKVVAGTGAMFTRALLELPHFYDQMIECHKKHPINESLSEFGSLSVSIRAAKGKSAYCEVVIPLSTDIVPITGTLGIIEWVRTPIINNTTELKVNEGTGQDLMSVTVWNVPYPIFLKIDDTMESVVSIVYNGGSILGPRSVIIVHESVHDQES